MLPRVQPADLCTLILPAWDPPHTTLSPGLHPPRGSPCPRLALLPLPGHTRCILSSFTFQVMRRRKESIKHLMIKKLWTSERIICFLVSSIFPCTYSQQQKSNTKRLNG